MRAPTGMHSSPRWKTQTSASRGPGARFRTCTRCWTARRCARLTTPTCRRFPNTGPSSGRTRRCSRNTGRCAIPPNSFSCRKQGEKSSTSRPAAIQEELARLGAKFSENLLDATNAFSIVVDEKRIAGIPEDGLHAAREAAQAEGKAGWKFTLHAPSYLPVMQYADDRKLRETMYRESVTRAAEFGRPEWDNTPLIARIVALRRELAQLLGYGSYAEVSLVPKMAESPGQVLRFLDDLARRARPFAERDVEELREFARNELHIQDLQAWDVAYASEKLRAKRYAFSDQEVKQYFPEDAAVAGLFRVAERLYGIRILPSKAPVWHEDVRFFEIRDSAGTASNPVIGQFYTDLYARDTKRGGAWMDDAITRRRRGGQLQTPA